MKRYTEFIKETWLNPLQAIKLSDKDMKTTQPAVMHKKTKEVIIGKRGELHFELPQRSKKTPNAEPSEWHRGFWHPKKSFVNDPNHQIGDAANFVRKKTGRNPSEAKIIKAKIWNAKRKMALKEENKPVHEVPLSQIKSGEGRHSKRDYEEKTINSLRKTLRKNRSQIPPISLQAKIKGEKKYYLLDGHHRTLAHRLEGQKTIRATIRNHKKKIYEGKMAAAIGAGASMLALGMQAGIPAAADEHGRPIMQHVHAQRMLQVNKQKAINKKFANIQYLVKKAKEK